MTPNSFANRPSILTRSTAMRLNNIGKGIAEVGRFLGEGASHADAVAELELLAAQLQDKINRLKNAGGH